MFRKRFHILTFAGIPIGVDSTWFIIAAFLSWTLAAGYFPHAYPSLSTPTYWGMGIIGMLGLFICVILHELGHALIAKRYRVPVAQITLFIFGGIAELKKEAKSPWVEFLIAIAGPIVSVFLSGFFFLLAHVGQNFPIAIIGVLSYLGMINAIIVIFNLIPAFPLDGGRILRSILWGWKKNLGWATKVTSQLGMGFGFFLIFFGIFHVLAGHFITGIWFAILGLFLQRAASTSQTQFHITRELKGERIERFMKTDLDYVSPNITVQDLIDHHIYQSHHQLYPVLRDRKLLGYVTVYQVKALPHDKRATTWIQELIIAPEQLHIISPKAHAMQALEQMHDAPYATLFVLENDQCVGIVTAQDLLKIVSLKLELDGISRY